VKGLIVENHKVLEFSWFEKIYQFAVVDRKLEIRRWRPKTAWDEGGFKRQGDVERCYSDPRGITIYARDKTDFMLGWSFSPGVTFSERGDVYYELLDLLKSEEHSVPIIEHEYPACYADPCFKSQGYTVLYSHLESVGQARLTKWDLVVDLLKCSECGEEYFYDPGLRRVWISKHDDPSIIEKKESLSD
jgi:hypothetical protein